MPDIPLLTPLYNKWEDYQREVVDDKIKGHGLRALLETDKLGLLGKSSPILGGILPAISPNKADASEASSRGLVGRQWVEAAYRNSPWQNFASGALLDPTNLVGFGLPGMGAKAATKVPLIGRELSAGLKAANVLDQLPGQAVGKGFEVVGKAGRGALQGVADVVGPHVPQHPLLDKFGKGYDKTLQGWREQVLISGGYPAANYSGNAILAAQKGQWDVVRATLLGPLRGRDKRVTDILTKLGNNRAPLTYPTGTTPPPIDPTGFNPRWSGQTQKLGREPNINNPLSTPSVLRDIPDWWGPANKARDIGAGWSEGFKRFNQNRIEGPGVDQAFYKKFRPEFQRNRDEFYRELRAIEKAQPGNPLPKNAADAFQAAKGQMSPDDLREILFPGTRARRAKYAASPGPRAVSNRVPDWRDDLIKNWEDRIITSMEAGTKNSTDIFFDYAADNPVDKLGRATLAFHRFSLNNIPKSLTASAEHPLVGNIPVEWYRVSDQYNEQQGLPRSFHGKYPTGPTLPNGMQVMLDPMQYNPLGLLIKAATRPPSTVDDKGTGLGEAFEDLKDIGLGLNPFIDAMLTVTGQHGRSFAPSFLRASQPVNGIASAVADRPVDIEGYPKELLGNAQEAITGQRPFPYQEYLLRKRQAELKAFGKDPALAGSSLGNQMAAEGVGGFVGIPGLKLLSPEEQKIRRNAALAKAYRLAGNDQAYRANPTSRAYADLDPRDEAIRQWDKQSADVRQRLFRDPEVRDELVNQYNWRKLSASERQRLLLDPEYRDRLLDSMSQQLHNNGASRGPVNTSPWLRNATPTPAARK